MKTTFSANVKGSTILILFIFTSIVYVIMLTVTIPQLIIFSDGRKIMDMMPGGYDVSYVKDLMNALSAEGRSYYLTKQLPLDFIYPALFAITYTLIFMFLLRKINKHTSAWKFAAWLPIIAGIADYLENICIISLIGSFPEISNGLVQFSSAVSILKASATTVYFITLIILLSIVALSKIRSRAVTSR